MLDQIKSLRSAARSVLGRSTSLGGDNDYTDLYGARGRFLTSVHSQQKCQVCGAKVTAIKTGGRTAYVCPACQPTS